MLKLRHQETPFFLVGMLILRIIFGKQYWIYPTFSAPYNKQVFFDAFSSPDLVNGPNTQLFLIPHASNGQNALCEHLLLLKKEGNIIYFLAQTTYKTTTKKEG
jgi:hypothetical protein